MGERDLGRKWNLVKMYRYILNLGKKKIALSRIMNHHAREDVTIFLLYHVFRILFAFSWLGFLTQRTQTNIH